MSVQSYSPSFVSVSISTPEMNHMLTGYAEGTFISIEPFADRITPVYGAQGEAYRVFNPVEAVTMTVTLSQTSYSNDVLTLLHDLDKASLNGTFTLIMKDSSGRTVYVDEFAYIGTEPTQSFSGGGTLENREWSIHLPKPDRNIGGNGNFSADAQRNIEQLGGTVDPQWQSTN